ncbi:uncharacterized protein LOC121998354 isoform X2 [Zingiber officinale]|uniref:uncharacterized protein LOC121998354 isoform X2 n=1 Tax=Zingiber officinale TaxID=94328 RepID=UPI001C4A9CE2|nr:uncharacterized protein LOC121998354 isoform X2 [Zingiber officinale]
MIGRLPCIFRLPIHLRPRFLQPRLHLLGGVCDQFLTFGGFCNRPRVSSMDALPQKHEAASAARSCGPNWFVAREGGGCEGWSWTAEENKRFEEALAKFDGEAPDRWAKVAASIPGKTVGDVIYHHRELVFDVIQIEAGRVPCAAYGFPPSLTLDSEGRRRVKRSGGRSSDHERKKGVPWTEEEHRSEQVRQRRLEEHIAELGDHQDPYSGGQPRAEVLPQAQLRQQGQEKVQHPRHHYG